VYAGFAKTDYMADMKIKDAAVPKHHAVKACEGMELKRIVDLDTLQWFNHDSAVMVVPCAEVFTQSLFTAGPLQRVACKHNISTGDICTICLILKSASSGHH
jgi:hypothetical protein